MISKAKIGRLLKYLVLVYSLLQLGTVKQTASSNMKDFSLPLITKPSLKFTSLSNICLPMGVHKNEKALGHVLFLSLGILPFHLSVGSW